MNKALFLVPVLCVLPLLAQAAPGLPLAEADYLRGLESQFDAADKNHDAALDMAELQSGGAGAFENPFISEATKQACMKSGQAMMTQFQPPRTAEGREQPLLRKDFVEGQKGLFEQVDANHDKTATKAEADAFDKMSAEMCAAAPAMLHNAAAMQGMVMDGKMSPEAMKAKIMQQMKNMPGAPKGAP